MVLLPVDEAYAMDYMAILMVKQDYGLPVKEELNKVSQLLKVQMPEFEKVQVSNEFHLLYIANQVTFEAVAKCKTSPAQKANRKRFFAKRKLQERFWPKQPLTEVKRKGE